MRALPRCWGAFATQRLGCSTGRRFFAAALSRTLSRASFAASRLANLTSVRDDSSSASVKGVGCASSIASDGAKLKPVGDGAAERAGVVTLWRSRWCLM